MRYVLCSKAFAEIMETWLRAHPGITEGHIREVIRPGTRRQRSVRQDWHLYFAQTDYCRSAFVERHAAAVRRKMVGIALVALGFPERLKLPQLAAEMPSLGDWAEGKVAGGSTVKTVLRGFGYAPDPNPDDRRGRWYYEGRQVRGYRRIA